MLVFLPWPIKSNLKCFFCSLLLSRSGAEDRHGYIWDRYYGILLAKLPHRDVVNSVAFNPRDPEMLITASDDHSLKIWYSRLKAEQSQGAMC